MSGLEVRKQDFKETKELQNVLLAQKQGDALERASTPRTNAEAISLGHYEVSTNIQLNLLITYEKMINEICGLEGNEIADMCYGISRASANRNAMRVDKTLETVGQLGQFRPGPPKFSPWNEPDKAPEVD